MRSTSGSPGGPRIHGLLDLRALPLAEQWERIATAARRLEEEHGPVWRLKILVPDTPEAAAELPLLVTWLTNAGLRHDSVREPGGGQGLIVSAAANRPGFPLLAGA